MLEVGMKAPQFTLPDKNGNMVSLSDFLGKKVILYFYPKDNTPGCTRQACAFALKNKVSKNSEKELTVYVFRVQSFRQTDGRNTLSFRMLFS